MFRILCSAVFLLMTPWIFAQDEPSWRASAGTRYMNRYTAYGIELGNESPAVSAALSLRHKSGLSLGVDALQTTGSAGELQHWSVTAGYELEVSETVSISAAFTHYEYSSDSVNVLAGLANSVEAGVDVDFGPVGAGISYDRFLGSSGASYVSVSMSSFVDLESVWIVPLVQATFMSQEVESRLLATTGKGKNAPATGTSASTTSSITGLSSVSLHAVLIVPVVDNLSVTFHPSYLYSPKSELSSSRSRFVWAAGMRYSVDF